MDKTASMPTEPATYPGLTQARMRCLQHFGHTSMFSWTVQRTSRSSLTDIQSLIATLGRIADSKATKHKSKEGALTREISKGLLDVSEMPLFRKREKRKNTQTTPKQAKKAKTSHDDNCKFKKEYHARYPSPILDQVSAQSVHTEEGSMENPCEFWQFATRGSPSVSFNTIKKKTCTSCHDSTYYQTPQDIDVNSIELYGQASSKNTFPHVLNSWFKDQAIRKHKDNFSTCSSCNNELPFEQKTVMLDRPPHFLCVGMNTGEKDSLPDLKDPNTVLDGVELKFEHISGEERSVKYKTIALVYSSGLNHFVSAVKVKYKKTASSKTAVEGWLECDGQKGSCREVDGRTLKPKIKSGAVARVLLKRVYNESENGAGGAVDGVLVAHDAARETAQAGDVGSGRSAGASGDLLLFLEGLNGLLHLARVLLQTQNGPAHLLLTGEGMLKFWATGLAFALGPEDVEQISKRCQYIIAHVAGIMTNVASMHKSKRRASV
ncbi:hypothetical protein KCU81_g6724, partial [Aureobasidium melanogenum]|uniref:Uncharacterized protein n=1 Tax=Aureobasidium melanogenum (strain CBS 110374) TaxID=1043003 RepID=A0A074VNQ4_AURM1